LPSESVPTRFPNLSVRILKSFSIVPSAPKARTARTMSPWDIATAGRRRGRD
jgi:hypothetical protein